MLKYIIFTEASGEECALFGLAPTKHLELSLMAQSYKAGRRIVSAGFVEFIYLPTDSPRMAGEIVGQTPGGEHAATGPLQLTARTHGFSDSLGLHPRPVDAKFLTVFARATANCCAASIAHCASA